MKSFVESHVTSYMGNPIYDLLVVSEQWSPTVRWIIKAKKHKWQTSNTSQEWNDNVYGVDSHSRLCAHTHRKYTTIDQK